MDDDESRPAAAHKTTHLRKVPGSFDDDEISPAKENFDHLPVSPAPPAAGVLVPADIPRLLPPPPAAADQSYLDGPSRAADKVSDSFTEQVVRDHLQDIESSFAAPLSPIPTKSQDGVDDTFLFDSPRKQLLPPPSQPLVAADAPPRDDEETVSRPATAVPIEDSRVSEPSGTVDPTDVGNATSYLEGFSSPTAEATARSVSKALSRSDVDAEDQDGRSEAATDDWDVSTRRQSQLTDTTRLRSPSFSGTTPTLRNRTSDADLGRTSTDAAGSSGPLLRYGRRPRYLRSRDASQRSSVSSFATNTDSHDDVESDVTVGLGTDYALQSGGAVPALNSSRSLSNMSNILARSISMGSMLSGIDDFPDSSSGRLRTLDEDDTPSTRPRGDDAGDHDLLQTPKAKGPPAAPTDTVLARRVMDVHVPASLAEEYKARGGLTTPKRPSDQAGGGGGGGGGGAPQNTRNLTLKEQSSTIDRLSKENFNLKLKVMFLSDRLDRIIDTDSKAVEQENIQLRTNAANLQRDNKTLRKRIRELERQARDDDERPATASSAASPGAAGRAADPFDADAQEREEELTYLRETVREYSTVIENLRRDNLAKEAEKRRMADAVKSLQATGEKNVGESLGRQEAEDVWKDLLEQETARREQAVEDGRKLQDEIYRLKHPTTAAPPGVLHHTTNIYNIAKKPRAGSPSRSASAFSGEAAEATDGAGGGPHPEVAALLAELKSENETFKHENNELRREVGAQASMLTSRNKEKERLYAEIEELKMVQRRGGAPASTIDSLFERSASQIGAHERSASRMSGGTRAETALEDPEREELENKNAELRDRINGVKLDNQNLAQDLEEHRLELEAAHRARLEVEDELVALREELDTTVRDLMAMQQERDDVIQELSDADAKLESAQREFNTLREEAQDAIDAYEGDAAAADEDILKLTADLGEKSDNFAALQEEMRKLSESLVGLEDEQDNKTRRIQQLEQQLTDAHAELEDLDARLVESGEKNQRLAVQQESGQGEIAFLREEQEGDKVQISRLDVAVSKAEEALREEQDRVRQLQAQIAEERERSEALATNDKKEMQRFVNELHREASASKDESRRLRKSLASRESEAAEWKERLMELENNLRGALGDLNGTRSSLVKSIAGLQRELESTGRELDATKAALAEKERIVKARDGLLESHGAETRKVADALETERAAHRNAKHQFETFQKTHQHVSRTVAAQDARILELETARAQDKKRAAQLEAVFKEQLHERNNLLLVLWTRLSSLCGTDWAHDNSLISGRALPSLEAVATMLPGFSKNLLAAVKTIETLVGGFQARVKGVERDLWREYHSLEEHLAARTKKLERLEAIVRNGVASGSFGTAEMQNRLMSLQEAYRQLKVENATLRTASEVRARSQFGGGAAQVDANGGAGLDVADLASGSPSPSVPTGPRERANKDRPRPKTGSRIPSRAGSSAAARPMTAGELALHEGADDDGGSGGSGGGASEPYPADPRWILRLRDLESKLKLEREGRLMDRSEASKRLLEQEAELNQLSRKDGDRRRRREESAG